MVGILSRPARLGPSTPIAIAIITVGVVAQSGAQKGEWRTYGGDLGGTRYSPLSQITAENFPRLEVAWRFKTDNLGPQPEFNFQSTPLMANGVLYSTGGTRRAVVALNPGTGELLWRYGLDEGERGTNAPRVLSGKGLAYWTDGVQERVVYVTPGYQLIALDAKTGRPVAGFGKNGIVDLKQELDQSLDPLTADIGLHAAPVIGGNTIIIGAAHEGSFQPPSRRNVKGFVRGYDVRTGKRLWLFRTIPSPGEFGNDTWEEDSWSYTGNTGVWAQITIDEELGIVYLPVEMATGDVYGGHRPGNGLFGESLVALDLKTGKRRWHYQLIHHGLWDRDPASAPVLGDITVNGKRIKAVAVPTKQAWVYVFDRVTGVPVWPIEERPVPQSDVPGEKSSPTQPFPTKPPPFDRQGLTIDDLIDFTPELRAEAVKVVSRYRIGPLYTPPVVSKPEGPIATLMLPAEFGGANWGGGSFDPETGIIYVFSNTQITPVGLVAPKPGQSDMNFIRGIATGAPSGDGGRQGPGGGDGVIGGGGGFITVQGLPLVKPPWGRITAINLNQGEIVWQVPHGETPDYIRNHPALKGVNIPRTGRQGRLGVLTTQTLVIAGEGGFFTTPSGRRGAMLRAYDKATGKEVGAVYMPAPQTGSPMTYLFNGRQYIVIAISGPGYSGELLALRLPA